MKKIILTLAAIGFITVIAENTSATANAVAVPVANTTRGSEFTFAGGTWRILDTDMDDDASNGLQALVIRVTPLSTKEATGSGSESDIYLSGFKVQKNSLEIGNWRFFDQYGVNGYEGITGKSSKGDTETLMGALDYYYTHSIAPNNADVVQAVDLHNPNFDEFKAERELTYLSLVPGSGIPGCPWFGQDDYYDWTFSGNFWDDTHSATTLDNAKGEKQAFALSYGDIHGHMGLSTGTLITELLYFEAVDISHDDCEFFLRSPAGATSVGAVAGLSKHNDNMLPDPSQYYHGCITASYTWATFSQAKTIPVVLPALSLSICEAK